MTSPKKLPYMLDTNIFNHILDGTIDISELTKLRGEFFVTHIQLDELNATPDLQRRIELVKVFHEIYSTAVPTESSVWGVSRWGQAKWTTNDSLYAPIVRKLAVGQKRWSRKHDSNMRDALIAETSIRNNYTLLTNDVKLGSVVKDLGGKTQDLVG